MDRLKNLLVSRKYLALGITGFTFLGIILIWGWNNGTLASSANDVPGSDTIASVGVLFDILLKLGFVLLLIFVSVGVMRYFQNKAIGQPARRMSVKESLRLSSRQVIHVVKVGSQELLIGATDQSINFLTELDPELESDSENVEISNAEVSPNSFGSLFESMFSGGSSRGRNNP